MHAAVDSMLFVVALLANLLLAGVFLARAKGHGQLQYDLGIAFETLALPLVVGAVLNLVWQREWWTVALPLALLPFLAVELLFDYVWRLDFRSTRLLGPYLALYYVGLIALTGYAFSLGKLFGFVALATYFANLAASGYSYSRVGHGSDTREVPRRA
jgi:hypothetical protein